MLTYLVQLDQLFTKYIVKGFKMEQWINLMQTTSLSQHVRILYCRINWLYSSTASASYGRQAGSQAKKIQVGLKIFKILYSILYQWYILLQYYYSITTVLKLHFCKLLYIKDCFKVCLEMQKFQLPFFSWQSIPLSPSIPNDTYSIHK